MSVSSAGSISVMIPVVVTLPYPQNVPTATADDAFAVTSVGASAGLSPVTSAASSSGAGKSNPDDAHHKGEHAGHHKPSPAPVAPTATMSISTQSAVMKLPLGGV